MSKKIFALFLASTLPFNLAYAADPEAPISNTKTVTGGLSFNKIGKEFNDGESIPKNTEARLGTLSETRDGKTHFDDSSTVKVSNLTDGNVSQGSTDAITGNQLHASNTRIDGIQALGSQNKIEIGNINTRVTSQQSILNNHEDRITELEKNSSSLMNSKIDDLDKKFSKAMASNAALSGLFQPYNVGRVNITAGIGGYKSHQAAALGVGYRINDSFAAKVGVAVSGSNNTTYNASVNYDF
ncbi:MAG: YadA-like family protein [Neisseriaceae bacterium]|nr:YadA-like family protein [Neisseriaceae bacterium]